MAPRESNPGIDVIDRPADIVEMRRLNAVNLLRNKLESLIDTVIAENPGECEFLDYPVEINDRLNGTSGEGGVNRKMYANGDKVRTNRDRVLEITMTRGWEATQRRSSNTRHIVAKLREKDPQLASELKEENSKNLHGELLSIVRSEFHHIKEKSVLEEKASVDSLTQVHNRRSLWDLMKINLGVCERKKHGMSVLMLDLDHFKNINDEYGHPVGDEVLTEFARRMKTSVRESDVVGRWGGEEFVIALPEINIENAIMVAERIMRAVVSEPVTLKDGRKVPISVSIGIADYPNQALTRPELIEKADEQVYKAKERRGVISYNGEYYPKVD